MTGLDSADVAIIGAGPAGLATAIGARLAGLDVVLVEKRHPPLDKPCGEGVMPDGALALARLGLPIGDLDAVPFRGIRLLEGDLRCEARFPGEPGLGIRRTRLSAAMLARAEELGTRLHFGVRATAVSRRRIDTTGGSIAARTIVVADGLASPLRLSLGLTRESSPDSRRYGVRGHFAREPWTDHVEVHFSDGAEAYVTPVGHEEVGVALLWSRTHHVAPRFEELLARFPVLADRLGNARALDRVAGAGPLRRGSRARAAESQGIALVGDAAGYVDAITGEGISVALHSARALVEAIAADDLSRYERAWRRINRTPALMTALMLGLARRRGLRHRALRVLASEPAIFERFLAVHTGTLPVRRFGVVPAARLAALIAMSH